MRLRNKKTGEIVGLSIYGIMLHIRNSTQPRYYSISELNEEWEDYKPQKSLINLKIDNNQKLLIEEAVVMFASQDKLRGGYHLKQAQEILDMLVNAELCGEEE